MKMVILAVGRGAGQRDWTPFPKTSWAGQLVVFFEISESYLTCFFSPLPLKIATVRESDTLNLADACSALNRSVGLCAVSSHEVPSQTLLITAIIIVQEKEPGQRRLSWWGHLSLRNSCLLGGAHLQTPTSSPS